MDAYVGNLASLWLNEVKDTLLVQDTPKINIVIQTSDSLDQEFDKATQDIKLLFPTIPFCVHFRLLLA